MRDFEDEDLRRRRRARTRHHVWQPLALAGMIFVAILAIPYCRIQAGACKMVSTLSGQGDAMPCGLTELSLTIDTDHRPFVWVSVGR